jgi:hypothetical protein
MRKAFTVSAITKAQKMYATTRRLEAFHVRILCSFQRIHAVGDSYLLLTRPSPQLPSLELRFQFRYAAPQPPRLLELNPHTLWFSSAGPALSKTTSVRKVETTDVSQALASRGGQLRYNQLREEIMQRTKCSKRTAQLAITHASQQGLILQDNGQYRLPL